MTLDSYDPKGVAAAVYAIRAKKACGPQEAVAELLASLSDEDALALMRGPFGTWALLEVERESLHTGKRPAHMPANYGTNRRALRLAGKTAWDYEVAIGNTGIRKRLGDVTDEDCRVMERQLAAAAETFAAQSKGWRSVGRKLKDGETLEAAAARLSDMDREFLAREVGAKDLAA